MNDNNNMIGDLNTIGNILNSHFSTLGTNVLAKTPQAQGSYRNYLTECGKNAKGKRNKGTLLTNPNGCSSYPRATDPDKIQKITKRLDSSKFTGPFGIPILLLKTFKEFFSIWLS